MPPRRGLPAALLIVLLAAPAAAVGQSTPERGGAPKPSQSRPSKRTAPTVESSRFLWATVNVCDTKDSPDTIGVRGSMPGAADSSERMYMRFQVQFFSAADGMWHDVSSGGDSGFVPVGSARYESRQSGRSFRFSPKSGSVLLRGVATFEWRRAGEVVRRARKRTTPKHHSSAGADPPGYSSSNCTITTG